mmetsp:Transcript_75243/g.232670  ORF Transcript_75243/g.232670 Transcript_75243/m.232670 type:complete len:312 (-) Transcript_75243:424-1359(-)
MATAQAGSPACPVSPADAARAAAPLPEPHDERSETGSASADEASSSESEAEDAKVMDDEPHMGPQLSHGTVFSAVVKRSLSSHEEEEPAKRQPCLTPNVKALAFSAFLFALITIVQVFAARMAKSQALLADCISMGVDALTYLGNIVVECKKRDGGAHVLSQLVIVACSLGCLIYFTEDTMRESSGIVQVCRGQVPGDGVEEDVNGWITLSFALGGVAFDVACLIAFYRSSRESGSARHVNMFSALLQVGADFLRSTSTLIMSLLILVGGFDSTCLDAYTSLFIGTTIIAGASAGLYSWMRLFVSRCRRQA